MSDKLKPCPLCHSSQVQICRDANNPAKDTCRCRECWCTGKLAVWNGRTAPVSAPLDTQALPPLPVAWGTMYGKHQDKEQDGYTTDQMRGYAIDHAAPYAARIAHLERELELSRCAFIGSENARKNAERAAEVERKPVSIGRDSDFWKLMNEWREAWLNGPAERLTRASDALIAYIDGRTAGTAPKAPDPTEAAIEQRAKEIYAGFVFASRYPWVEGGNSIRQDEARREARGEFAAVLSPQSKQEEAE